MRSYGNVGAALTLTKRLAKHGRDRSVLEIGHGLCAETRPHRGRQRPLDFNVVHGLQSLPCVRCSPF